MSILFNRKYPALAQKDDHMKSSRVKKILCKMLGPSGVQVDGSRPWDIRVHNSDFYERVLSGGSLALGKATWMAGGTVKPLINSLKK